MTIGLSGCECDPKGNQKVPLHCIILCINALLDSQSTEFTAIISSTLFLPILVLILFRPIVRPINKARFTATTVHIDSNL